MNIVFIGASSVGPRWIMSGLKRANHKTWGIFLGYESVSIGEYAVPFHPPVSASFLREVKVDIVGITMDSLNVDSTLQIIETIRRDFPEVKIIVGGIHPTIEPEEAILFRGVDYICIGEGEQPMLDLCNALTDDPSGENGLDRQIPNIWSKRGDQIFRNPNRSYTDINAFEFDREGIAYNGVFTGRGCAGNCNFCASPFIKTKLGVKGKYFRKRELQSVFDEMDRMIRLNYAHFAKTFWRGPGLINRMRALYHFLRNGFDPIRIKDDSFLIDKRWFFPFAEEFSNRFYLRRRGFICSARVNEIDEKIVVALKKANCKTIILGFESGDEGYRNFALRKQVKDEQIYKVAALLNEAGITMLGQWMIGMPGETPDQALKSLKMSLEIGDIPQVHIATPLPKTRMLEQAQELGYFLAGQRPKVTGIYQDFTMVQPEHRNTFRQIYNAFKIINACMDRNMGRAVFSRFKGGVERKRVGEVLLDGVEFQGWRQKTSCHQEST